MRIDQLPVASAIENADTLPFSDGGTTKQISVGNLTNSIRDNVYGAPLTASTSSAMTDTSRIYVYTGTTGGGFTNGHWYYYNGSAWTDGGIYNSVAVQTDPTLTLEGIPADAKATGDRIALNVRYDTAQSLTTAQQQQARTNIGAADADASMLIRGLLPASSSIDTLFQPGAYYAVNSSVATITGWPADLAANGRGGLLEVVNGQSYPGSAPGTVQIITALNNGEYHRLFRMYLSDTWQEWTTIANSNGYNYHKTINQFGTTGIDGDYNKLLECGTYFVPSNKTPTNGPFDNVAFDGFVSVLSYGVGSALWFFQIAYGDSPAAVRGRVQFRTIKGDGTVATAWRDLKAFSYDYAALQTVLKDYTPTNVGIPSTGNLNLLTDAGCYYVNSSNVSNAPMGLTECALLLINTPTRIGSGRSLLQTAIIQDPAWHRNEVWYRFMTDDAATVYMDWFTDNKARYVDKITVFGDSITAGYPNVDTPSYHWWEYLKPDYDISNYAQTGAGVVYKAGSRSGCTMADSFTDSSCDYVVIFMGTNDYGNNIPIGNISDTPASDGTFCAGLRYMIEKIMTNNPTISIIGVLPLNRTKFGSTSLDRANHYAYGTANGAGYTLGDLCNKAEQIYHDYGIPVIDSRNSAFQLDNLNSILGDGLHPNLTGYRKLAGFMGGQIRSIVGNV